MLFTSLQNKLSISKLSNKGTQVKYTFEFLPGASECNHPFQSTSTSFVDPYPETTQRAVTHP